MQQIISDVLRKLNITHEKPKKNAVKKNTNIYTNVAVVVIVEYFSSIENVHNLK